MNIPIILPFSNFLANVSPQITEFYQAILFMATMWKLRSSIKLSIQCKSFLKKQSSVKYIQEFEQRRTGAPIEAKGSAILNDPFDPLVPGELIVNFEDQPSFSRSTSTNYNVIDTDYDNFTIIYSCNNYGFLKSELLWILTRQRFPGKLLINHLMQKIRKLGLNTSRLKRTDQKTCGARYD